MTHLSSTSTALSLLEDGTLSDAVILCGEKKDKVHRFVLALHSSYFKKLLSDRYKPADGFIELDAGDATAFDRVKHYFYALTYDDEVGPEEDFRSSLEVNATVYALAEKYECAELKKIAVTKFGKAAKDMLIDRDVLEMIRIVYNTTPSTDRGLRDVCVALWAVAGSNMVAESERAMFQVFLEEVPGFAVDIALHYASTFNKAKINDACACHGSTYVGQGGKRDLKEAMEHRFVKPSVALSVEAKLDRFWE